MVVALYTRSIHITIPEYTPWVVPVGEGEIGEGEEDREGEGKDGSKGISELEELDSCTREERYYVKENLSIHLVRIGCVVNDTSL